MKKTLVALAALLAIGTASAQSVNWQAQNHGNVDVRANTSVSVQGDGDSRSVVNSSATSTFNAGVSVTPGSVAGVTGAAAGGFANGTTNAQTLGYNVATGNGVGSFTGSANATGNAGFTGSFNAPGQSLNIGGGIDANQTTANVAGSTKTDGWAGSTQTLSSTSSGAVGSGHIPGGAVVVGSVTGETKADSSVGVGGVTFNGGTPAGQSAAPRSAGATGSGWATGAFADPVGQ